MVTLSLELIKRLWSQEYRFLSYKEMVFSWNIEYLWLKIEIYFQQWLFVIISRFPLFFVPSLLKYENWPVLNDTHEKPSKRRINLSVSRGWEQTINVSRKNRTASCDENINYKWFPCLFFTIENFHWYKFCISLWISGIYYSNSG